MGLFVRAEDAPPAKTRLTELASLLLAAILVVISMAQLYSFEDFLVIVGGFGLPGGGIWAVLLITAQIGALPFLLGMRLSSAFRILSLGLGWAALAVWMVVSVKLSLSGEQAGSGLLGTAIELPAGTWMILFFLGLGGLHGLASWGRWSSAIFNKSKNKG